MTFSLRRRLRGSEDGSTVVEFAFAAPVILAIILGVVETGRLGLASSNVKEATIAGARLYRLFPIPPDSAVQDAILARFERSGSVTVSTPVIETNAMTINGQRVQRKLITFRVVHTTDVPFAGKVQFPLSYSTTMITDCLPSPPRGECAAG